MKAKEVLQILGISRQSLINYVKDGRIKVKAKLSKTFFEYDDDSVYALIGDKLHKKSRKIISYSRVSSQGQKKQLKEQTQRIYDSCIARGLVLSEQFEDIKSGMSSDRPGFQKMLQLIVKNEVEILVIENKDRLTRFGFEILETIFKYFGCKILVLNDVLENKVYEQELTEDLILIISYFSLKSCSHRKKLNKIRKELEQSDEK